MKWLDPKALFLRLIVLWLLILSAYVLLLITLTWLIRYWYVVALICGLVLLIRILIRRSRNGTGRW